MLKPVEATVTGMSWLLSHCPYVSDSMVSGYALVFVRNMKANLDQQIRSDSLWFPFKSTLLEGSVAG